MSHCGTVQVGGGRRCPGCTAPCTCWLINPSSSNLIQLPPHPSIALPSLFPFIHRYYGNRRSNFAQHSTYEVLSNSAARATSAWQGSPRRIPLHPFNSSPCSPLRCSRLRCCRRIPSRLQLSQQWRAALNMWPSRACATPYVSESYPSPSPSPRLCCFTLQSARTCTPGVAATSGRHGLAFHHPSCASFFYRSVFSSVSHHLSCPPVFHHPVFPSFLYCPFFPTLLLLPEFPTCVSYPCTVFYTFHSHYNY